MKISIFSSFEAGNCISNSSCKWRQNRSKKFSCIMFKSANLSVFHYRCCVTKLIDVGWLKWCPVLVTGYSKMTDLTKTLFGRFHSCELSFVCDRSELLPIQPASTVPLLAQHQICCANNETTMSRVNWDKLTDCCTKPENVDKHTTYVLVTLFPNKYLLLLLFYKDIFIMYYIIYVKRTPERQIMSMISKGCIFHLI